MGVLFFTSRFLTRRLAWLLERSISLGILSRDSFASDFSRENFLEASQRLEFAINKVNQRNIFSNIESLRVFLLKSLSHFTTSWHPVFTTPWWSSQKSNKCARSSIFDLVKLNEFKTFLRSAHSASRSVWQRCGWSEILLNKNYGWFVGEMGDCKILHHNSITWQINLSHFLSIIQVQLYFVWIPRWF